MPVRKLRNDGKEPEYVPGRVHSSYARTLDANSRIVPFPVMEELRHGDTYREVLEKLLGALHSRLPGVVECDHISELPDVLEDLDDVPLSQVVYPIIHSDPELTGQYWAFFNRRKNDFRNVALAFVRNALKHLDSHVKKDPKTIMGASLAS